MEVTKFWLLILSGGYLLVAVKAANSIFVNQLNTTNLKSSKTQFQFQFELSLAQLSPSLLLIWTYVVNTNVARTNVTMAAGISFRSSQEPTDLSDIKFVWGGVDVQSHFHV